MNFNAEARLREPKECTGDVVYDGDTFKLAIKPWIGSFTYETIRLLGIDTAELHGENHETAIEQRDFVRGWFGSEARGGSRYPFLVNAVGEDSFGRTIADVERKSDNSVLSEAVLNEFGEEYTYDA
jgi:endonuclease YncB( thermonuclease family)